jgi:hypothetical protein
VTPETLTPAAVLKWVAVTTAFISVLILLMVGTAGYAPFMFALAFLFYFHPVPPLHVTDAELQAWLEQP